MVVFAAVGHLPLRNRHRRDRHGRVGHAYGHQGPLFLGVREARIRSVAIRVRTRSWCPLALILLGAFPLQASDTTFVEQGERVRVSFGQETSAADRSGADSYTSESVRLVGEVTVLESNSLVLLPEGAEASLTIPHDAIAKIEVSLGKKWDPDRGAIVGFGTMLVLGVAWSVFLPSSCLADADCLVPLVVLGAGVGWTAALPRERWGEAQLPSPPSVALNIGKDGSVQLAFSVWW